MIDLYTWTTPNGRKVSIMLEETGLDYTVHPVNLGEGEQHSETFLRLSPQGKIPAIVDHDAPGSAPLSLAESGAILIHLAERTGQFLPSEPRQRAHTIQWLMVQMGHIGPIFGQAAHFHMMAPEDVPYAKKRFYDEGMRLLGVIDERLSETGYLAGGYSIADMATYPWLQAAGRLFDLSGFANVRGWIESIGQRPAVQRGMAVPERPAS